MCVQRVSMRQSATIQDRRKFHLFTAADARMHRCAIPFMRLAAERRSRWNAVTDVAIIAGRPGARRSRDASTDHRPS